MFEYRINGKVFRFENEKLEIRKRDGNVVETTIPKYILSLGSFIDVVDKFSQDFTYYQKTQKVSWVENEIDDLKTVLEYFDVYNEYKEEIEKLYSKISVVYE